MPKLTLKDIANKIKIPKNFELNISYIDLKLSNPKLKIEFFVFEDLFNKQQLVISDDARTWINLKNPNHYPLPQLVGPIKWKKIKQLSYNYGIQFLSNNEFTIEGNLSNINAEVQNFAKMLIQIKQIIKD